MRIKESGVDAAKTHPFPALRENELQKQSGTAIFRLCRQYAGRGVLFFFAKNRKRKEKFYHEAL